MWRPAALLVIAGALALAGAGCGGSSEDTGESAPAPPPVSTDAVPPAAGGDEEEGVRGGGGDVPAARQGEPLPAIVGTTLDGRSLDLASYRGKKLIVHLWSSW